MRRFEVYFLQKKLEGVWETLERAQSVSVLVASLVREFDAREDAEVRILAGAYDEAAQDWEFTQIFFADRGAVELALSERDEAAGTGDATTAPADTGTVDDARADDLSDRRDTVPGGRAFADAIQRASDESDPLETDNWIPPPRRGTYDEFPDDELPVGPPPRFEAPHRRSGRAFFVIGTIVIALVLTAAAVLGLGIALDAPQVEPVLSKFRELTAGLGTGNHDADGSAVAAGGGNAVMPATTGPVLNYRGVAPGLRGRWSPGRCDETYVEFDADGLVVGAPGRPESLKVPVVETLEDDYTWYVRRSSDLVEHFQKLGSNDLQLVGDTTRAGFAARSSEVLTRCP